MALISSRTLGCPVCRAPGGACTTPGHEPDPQHGVIEMEDLTMADEKKKLATYEVEQSNGVTATLQLTDEDAKRMPGAKKRSSSSGGTSSPQSGDAGGKARVAPNK